MESRHGAGWADPLTAEMNNEWIEIYRELQLSNSELMAIVRFHNEISLHLHHDLNAVGMEIMSFIDQTQQIGQN